MARGVTHPSRAPSVAVTKLERLADLWESHQKAAEQAGLYGLAEVWESAALDLQDTVRDAKQRHAEAARAAMDSRTTAVADRVEGVAIARQLAETVDTIQRSHDQLVAQTDDQLERGLIVHASQTVAATEKAATRLDRAQRALEIVCDHWEIEPSEL